MLTAILADGVNLGLTRMADVSEGASLPQLAWAHDWHIRDETYAAALARLVDAQSALPLAQIWGEREKPRHRTGSIFELAAMARQSRM